jgi:hypothetical protein
MNSNDKLARVAGLLYLIALPAAAPAVFSGQLAMAGDAAATFANIQASQAGSELVIVLGAVGFTAWLILGVLLQRLLGSVSKTAVRLMQTFIVAAVILALAGMAKKIDVLYLLDSDASLGAGELQVHAMLALRSSNTLMLSSAIFWGLWLFPLGWLVFRSGFIPKVLGVLLIVGGVGYVLAFVGTVVDLDYQNTLLARAVGIVSGIPSIIGELGTALWLTIMGARGQNASLRAAALV